MCAFRQASCILVAIFTVSCGAVCGLGLHDRVTVATNTPGNVSCCDGAVYRDVSLMGRAGDPEFDLANTALPAEGAPADAFLVPTSCLKLFDGPYPGSTPLCQVLIGPAAPGKVAARVKLAAGTYRVWVQGYSSNAGAPHFLVDVGIWDYSCKPPIAARRSSGPAVVLGHAPPAVPIGAAPPSWTRFHTSTVPPSTVMTWPVLNRSRIR
jgi:hypothetical protein